MSAVDRAVSWFITPPPEQTLDGPPVVQPPPHGDAPYPSGGTTGTTAAGPAREGDSLGGWLPPGSSEPGSLSARRPPAPTSVPFTSDAAKPSRQLREPSIPLADLAPVAGREITAPPDVTCAAVLGRGGEVEPVAAALAHALRRKLRARTATVIALGGREPATELGGAARKLAAQLRSQGIPATARGRLACVTLEPTDPAVAAKARRAGLIASPVVLAVTVPRSGAIEVLLSEQDLLLIVTREPDGPLARVAAGSLAHLPLRVVPPLARGPARMVARAGQGSPRAIRDLVWPPSERRDLQ